MQEVIGIIDRRTGKADCPLKDVKVDALLGKGIAEVTVRQKYINTGGHTIEAIYTFPLPFDAQVTGFTGSIGNTEVKGEFREKEEALTEYEKAVGRGDSAFLLESCRPDIFRISLGNIASGESVLIAITYVQELKTTDGELRWTLPTVVAPRYIPGKRTGVRTPGMGVVPPTDRVPDADYITPPIGEAPYTLAVNAVLSGIAGIRKVTSPSHPVEVGFHGDKVTVSLARVTEQLDSDFVLSILLDSAETNSYITAGDAENGIFGAASLWIETEDIPIPAGGKEYAFLIDVSGSMTGEKLEQAKRALLISLRNLFEGDCFNIVAFESNYSFFSKEPVPYTQQNLEKADKWVNGLIALGGTEILEPLRHVLEQTAPENGMERVLLLFTDGQVGNENEILALVGRHSRSLQLFPFGIDTAVNKYFIDSLAKAGNGLPEYIYPGERMEEKVIRQFSRIGQPYLSGVRILGKDGSELETVPQLPLRMYGSESYPFLLLSRETGVLDEIRIRGTIGGNPAEYVLKPEGEGDARLLALQWAKGKLRMLEERAGGVNPRRNDLLRKEIVDLSLRYSILSTATSLVAVYNRTVRETGVPETIVVPVSGPRGWEIPDSPVYTCAPAAAVPPSGFLVRTAREMSIDGYSSGAFEDTGDATGIPSFLRKRSGKSGPSRASSRRSISYQSKDSLLNGNMAETDSQLIWGGPEMPERPEGAERPEGPERLESPERPVQEAMLNAARSQNADGSFGSGGEMVGRTACFLIGMLASDMDWKPYRLQIRKAARVLQPAGLSAKASENASEHAAGNTSENASEYASGRTVEKFSEKTSQKAYGGTAIEDLLLKAVAFSMLGEAKLLNGNELQTILAELGKALPSAEKTAFEAAIRDGIQGLKNIPGFEATTAMEKRQCSEYLLRKAAG